MAKKKIKKLTASTSKVSVRTPKGKFKSMSDAARAHNLFEVDRKSGRIKPMSHKVKTNCESKNFPGWEYIAKKDGTKIRINREVSDYRLANNIDGCMDRLHITNKKYRRKQIRLGLIIPRARVRIQTPKGIFKGYRAVAEAYNLYSETNAPRTGEVKSRCRSRKYPKWKILGKTDGSKVSNHLKVQRDRYNENMKSEKFREKKRKLSSDNYHNNGWADYYKEAAEDRYHNVIKKSPKLLREFRQRSKDHLIELKKDPKAYKKYLEESRIKTNNHYHNVIKKNPKLLAHHKLVNKKATSKWHSDPSNREGRREYYRKRRLAAKKGAK